MFIKDELKDWIKVVNISELISIFTKLSPIIERVCPNKEDILKAFNKCTLNTCKVIVLGQDPYPQYGVATGLAFANNLNTKESDISPSLRVLKESAIDYTRTHNYPIIFDNSLESWSEQGVLLLNSALTTEVNNIGSHTMLWRPFISSFLENLCKYGSGYVFILLGKQAQTFEPYIDKHHNHILKENHPSYYARTNKRMPSDIFTLTNNYLREQYNTQITWYNEPN